MLSYAKTEIVSEAKKVGIDLIGVASIERFDQAPQSHKPDYIMTGAKSVIVLAQRCLLGPMRNNQWNSYTTVHEGNTMRLDNAAYHLSVYLEEKYKANATPIPAGAPYYHWDENNQYAAGDLSHKHAAVAAGLGVIGKNSLLITPQYGNKVNLVSIITDIDIEPDPVIKTELCPENCHLCIKSCPAMALNDNYTINQAACRITVGRNSQKVFRY